MSRTTDADVRVFSVDGRKLEGTVVYSGSYKANKFGIYRTVLVQSSILIYFQYIFDPYDGLYASKLTRSLWKLHPETHPHATLFDMVYKKLEI